MKNIILIPLLSLIGTSAWACSAGFGDLSRIVPEAGWIFSGRVLAVNMLEHNTRYKAATVLVDEVWVGDLPDTVTVISSTSSCGAPFREGRDLMFFPVPPDSLLGEEWAFWGPLDEVPGVDKWMAVWGGTCERYERAGPATHILLGDPIVPSRDPDHEGGTLSGTIAVLEGLAPGDTNQALETMRFCRNSMKDLSASGQPGAIIMYERARESLWGQVAAARASEYGNISNAFYTLGEVCGGDEELVPRIRGLYHDDPSRPLGATFWITLKRSWWEDERVRDLMAEVALEGTDPEARAFALNWSWQGELPGHEGIPGPEAFLEDPDRPTRLLAHRNLARRTTDPDSLAMLADRALKGEDDDITVEVIRIVLEKMRGDEAARWAGRAMDHENGSVRWNAMGAQYFRAWGPEITCRVLRAARESGHDDVAKRGREYWREWGKDCE